MTHLFFHPDVRYEIESSYVWYQQKAEGKRYLNPIFRSPALLLDSRMTQNTAYTSVFGAKMAVLSAENSLISFIFGLIYHRGLLFSNRTDSQFRAMETGIDTPPGTQPTPTRTPCPPGCIP